MLQGNRFTATGQLLQLQQLARKLLLQSLERRQQQLPTGQAPVLEYDPSMLLWWYLGTGGVQMGPFSGAHLQQFASSGICQQDQLVCHGPSAVWLPLWLALQLVSTSQDAPAQPVPAQPMPAQPTPAQPTPAQPKQQQAASAGQQPAASAAAAAASAPRAANASPLRHGTAGSSAGQRPAVRSLKQPDSDDDEYGYGVSSDWLKKVKAVEAATKARQQQEKQQQAKKQEQKQQEQKQRQEEHGEGKDTEMEDVLAAVSLVRGDQEYLDDLHRAIDMDWEPNTQTGSDVQAAGATAAGQLPGAAAVAATVASTGPCSAVDLAALVAGAAATAEEAASSAALLVLVLDTNVLLEKKVVGFLQHVQRVQQQQGGQVVLPAAHSSSSGGSRDSPAAVRLRVVVPWTVLVELDRLKLSECLDVGRGWFACSVSSCTCRSPVDMAQSTRAPYTWRITLSIAPAHSALVVTPCRGWRCRKRGQGGCGVVAQGACSAHAGQRRRQHVCTAERAGEACQAAACALCSEFMCGSCVCVCGCACRTSVKQHRTLILV